MSALVGFGQEVVPLADAHGERQGAGLKGNRSKRYRVKVWSFHGLVLKPLKSFCPVLYPKGIQDKGVLKVL